MKHWSRVLGAAAVAVGLAGTAMAADPVKVGVILPLSGPSSLAGSEVIQGVRLAAEEANAAGGVLGGRQIELVVEDDESSPTKGATAARKLIEQDGVVAIVGTYNSAVAMSALKVAAEAKIPMTSGGSTSVGVTNMNEPGNPWFFRAFPGSDQQGSESGLDTVNVLGAKRLAIVHDNSSYGNSLADMFAEVTKANGAEIIARESYNAGEQDFYAMLTKLGALKPEAVYLAGLVGDGANIVRQASEMGIQTQFVGSGSMMTDKFIELTGPASEGFAVSSMFEPDTPNEHGAAFAKRFKERWGVNANVHSALGYDSMAVLAKAIDRAGSTDGTAIRDAMMKSGDVPLVQGPPGTTAAYDEKGSVNFNIGMAIVKDGKRQLQPF
ncbi:ABC transporter substrate-binding protein [Futiania mangrovi]|uniref:ABC transporter substrate-binding protein n=1 Tax=Futiania mangrovi TaxID=2959716 RepID=A0A9J6PBL4_9PROT|nr:ABC transporter substrate-binding protein [Futiania mangrovii]MCP1335128.1 ABC transporter substrate-binding protein [Futiania mangrovii]